MSILSFFEKIIGVIRNPSNETKSIAENPMIEEAVMIMGVYAAVGAIFTYLISFNMKIAVEGFENIRSIFTTIMIVFAFISVFIFWLITTGIIHFLSIASGGEGKFYPQMMTITGFSMLPMILSVIINIGLFLIIGPQTMPVSPDNPIAVNTSQPMIFSEIAGVIFQIFSTIILYYGIKNAHNLSSRTSGIIASIPLFFTLISLIITLRGTGVL